MHHRRGRRRLGPCVRHRRPEGQNRFRRGPRVRDQRCGHRDPQERQGDGAAPTVRRPEGLEGRLHQGGNRVVSPCLRGGRHARISRSCGRAGSRERRHRLCSGRLSREVRRPRRVHQVPRSSRVCSTVEARRPGQASRRGQVRELLRLRGRAIEPHPLAAHPATERQADVRRRSFLVLEGHTAKRPSGLRPRA